MRMSDVWKLAGLSAKSRNFGSKSPASWINGHRTLKWDYFEPPFHAGGMKLGVGEKMKRTVGSSAGHNFALFMFGAPSVDLGAENITTNDKTVSLIELYGWKAAPSVETVRSPSICLPRGVLFWFYFPAAAAAAVAA